MKKTCLLGITGSVAACKAPEIIRELQAQNFDVHCVVTNGGKQFAAPMALAAISGNKVYSNEFWDQQLPSGILADASYPHLQIAETADLIFVAPASADTIVRIAQGRANGVLEAAILASKKPVLVAPAMNTKMLEAYPTQKNIKRLRKRGIEVLPTETGILACGEVGAGRLLPPKILAHYAKRGVSEKILNDKRVLITLGRTAEPLDPVRILTNKSSGKTGVALALAAFYAGAEVTVVAGETDEALPDIFERTVDVITAADMLDATTKYIKKVDFAFFVAAVSDFSPKTSTDKINTQNNKMSIEVHKTKDVAAECGSKKKKDQRFFGFALETGSDAEAQKRALQKMQNKNLNGIFLNNPSNLNSDIGAYTLLSKGSKSIAIGGVKSEAAIEMLAAAVKSK